MFQTKPQITNYQSKGKTISKSMQHQDMWIISDNTTGKFHTLSASQESILTIHPMD